MRETDKDKIGLGLGLFIGKTLLEKNFASVNCWNSKKKSGAEVTITWKNKDLFKFNAIYLLYQITNLAEKSLHLQVH